jgi:hypothetical protein
MSIIGTSAVAGPLSPLRPARCRMGLTNSDSCHPVPPSMFAGESCLRRVLAFHGTWVGGLRGAEHAENTQEALPTSDGHMV